MADAFPSSGAFDLISSSLQSDEAERKDAVKKGNAIFAFTLKNKEGQVESWYMDLKEKGEVAKGTGPEGKKTDGMVPSVLLPHSIHSHSAILSIATSTDCGHTHASLAKRQSADPSLYSHTIAIRRRLRQADQRQGKRAKAFHGGQAEGQGGCDESYEDGADTEEGADQGQAII